MRLFLIVCACLGALLVPTVGLGAGGSSRQRTVETVTDPRPDVQRPAVPFVEPDLILLAQGIHDDLVAEQARLEAERVEAERASAEETARRQEAARAAQMVAQHRVSAPTPPAITASGDVWWQLALCECGGNPGCNTGNGFFGTFQFLLSTWHGVGGPGYPHEQPYEVQRHFAQVLQERSGWGQWPACARKLGLL